MLPLAGWFCPVNSLADAQTGEIRLMLDYPPSTLNPRSALDASGQRLGELLFQGLTLLDERLRPTPSLAARWEPQRQGRVWKFWIAPALKDQAGRPITAEAIARCMEEYRTGKPISRISTAIPGWESTRFEGDAVVFQLRKPDAYFPIHASLLRYFTIEGDPTPCREPRPGEKVIGSGILRLGKWETHPKGEITLFPANEGDHLPLRIRFVRDATSRALKFLRGEADAVQNAMPLAKTRWFQEKHADRFSLLEWEGVNVSYLSFNLKDPILSRKEVRKAIALAMDRELFVRMKMMSFGKLASGLLSPLLEEGTETPLPGYSPGEAERILDQAGFPRGKDGIRLRFKYKTTPAPEGMDMALSFQEMLRKVGIQLTLDVVEPAVFMASIRKGAFQIHSNRLIGVSNASAFQRLMHSKSPNNRAHYRSAKADALIDALLSETRLEHRKKLAASLEKLLAEDLPYLPLWYWRNAVLVRKELASRLDPERMSLTGSYFQLIPLLKAKE